MKSAIVRTILLAGGLCVSIAGLVRAENAGNSPTTNEVQQNASTTAQTQYEYTAKWDKQTNGPVELTINQGSTIGGLPSILYSRPQGSIVTNVVYTIDIKTVDNDGKSEGFEFSSKSLPLTNANGVIGSDHWNNFVMFHIMANFKKMSGNGRVRFALFEPQEEGADKDTPLIQLSPWTEAPIHVHRK